MPDALAESRSPLVKVRPNSTLAGLTLRNWVKSDAGLYQDSAATVPVTTEMDPVGCWQDQSGLGNHWLQTVNGNRPQYRTISGVFDARPIVGFDGATSYLACDALAAFLTGSDVPFTILASYRVSGTGSAQAVFGAGRSSTNNPLQIVGRSSLSLYSTRHDDTAAVVTATAAAANLTGAAQRASAYVFDGTSLTWQTGGFAEETVAMDLGATTLNTACLGALRRTTVGSFFTGYLGEFMLFSGAATAAQRRLLLQYLKGRWNTV